MTENYHTGGSGEDHATDSTIRWTPVEQQHYNPATVEEITFPITAAIAKARGVAPNQMTSPPLYDCIDVSALERLLFGPQEASRAADKAATVTFRYAEYLVKVTTAGWIQVFEPIDTELSGPSSVN